MHNTQSNSDDNKPPFNDFDMETDTESLISGSPRPEDARLVRSIELKPTEQQRIPLGSFTDSAPPRGFSVNITPDPNPPGSVITEVTSLGTTKEYELTLLITNYGTGSVGVEVWRL